MQLHAIFPAAATAVSTKFDAGRKINLATRGFGPADPRYFFFLAPLKKERVLPPLENMHTHVGYTRRLSARDPNIYPSGKEREI